MTYRRLLPLACLGLLAACATSNPPNYYTLVPGTQAPIAPVAAPANPTIIELMPVTVPAPIDVPQMVMRTGQGEVVLLNDERWAGPLADEIRSALAVRLVSRLGAPVVQDLRPDRRSRVLLVQVEVQRFDSVPGKQAVLDSVWRVRQMGGEDDEGASARAPAVGRPAAPVCRSYFATPAGGDMPALVQAHQHNVAALGDAIAAAVQAVRAGRPACPG
ncbi:PqiC family protein [Bordetella petrii]|uniref:PqiC family protein n=1 Tax=Bordetella petrii TaxID=94624 RepID=A0ABT7W987_9BORD|nr:PqiC family protein [Bordetella petrii]MDM9561764.1 PqiC family protein [Bordetella petrii]